MTDTILIRGVEQQDVSRDYLITLQLYKVSHVYIFPALFNVDLFASVKRKGNITG